jgi:hypothetical protein
MESWDLAKLLASLASLGRRKCPVELWDGVYARITAERQARRLSYRWTLRPVVAAPLAAAAALMAMLIFWPAPQTAMDRTFAREYTCYIGAHSHLQRQQAFVDPDVVFVRAELEKSRLMADE